MTALGQQLCGILERSQVALRPKSVNRRALPFPVEALSIYIPRRYRGDSRISVGDFDHYTSMCLLDLKYGQGSESLKFWSTALASYVDRRYDPSWLLCAVPSSSPDKPSGVARVVSAVCQSLGRVDCSNDVNRNRAIPRSSLRNRFDIGIHIKSLTVSGNVQGRKILLIDDVVTSGTTLLALYEILTAAGASQLRGLALAETIKDR